MKDEFIAHYRHDDKTKQHVKEHLEGVGTISQSLASKIDMPQAGLILGLLHDFGKNCAVFLQYILSAVGLRWTLRAGQVAKL